MLTLLLNYSDFFPKNNKSSDSLFQPKTISDFNTIIVWFLTYIKGIAVASMTMTLKPILVYKLNKARLKGNKLSSSEI